MKAYWQGTLACDFLTFPIKLYSAVTPLVLHTLFSSHELLDLSLLSLPRHPGSVVEVHAAQEGIRRLTGTYIPQQWTDRSQAALLTLIARKARSNANRVPRVTGRTRRTPPSSPKVAA
jgi:non-homologous end joining protein Ku